MKKLTILVLLSYCSIVSATNFYVSSSGSDASNGTSESSPWKTIAKVNAAFATFKPGDRILFRRGDTFHGTVKTAASGVSGKPILIGAYGSGSKPVITGLITVSSWTNEGNGIYSRSIACASNPNFIVINSKIYAMGRFPNSSYLSYESFSTNVSITDNELSSVPDWDGAEVVIMKNGWTLDRCLITSHSGTKITYTNLGTTTSGTANYGYFIQNSLKTLDVFGEWYYNGSKLYVYFGSRTPSDYKIDVPTINNLVYNYRNSYISLDNIQFIGSGRSNVILETYADYCVIKDCNFNYSGEHTIVLPVARYAKVDNNTINNSVNAGIFVDASIKTVITNNTIKNTGLLLGAGFKTTSNAGIYCVYSDDALIQYNSIDSSSYNGIRFNGNRVLVKNNLVKNSVLLVNDGASIYTSGKNFSGRVVEGNIVVHSYGNTDGTNKPLSIYAEGIYLDGPSQDIVVRNNTATNCRRSGIFFHESHDNICTGNTSFDNTQQVRFQFGNVYPEDKIRNIDFYDNIFISKSSTSLVLWARSTLEDIPQFVNSDNNYYARPINDNAVIYTQSPTSGVNNRTLSSWKTFSSQDPNSQKSPISIKSTSEIELFYNASKSDTVIALKQPMIDIKGKKYAGSITLLPYNSAVLMVDPAPAAAPAVPVYQSSVIENATPSILAMTYTLSLTNIIPFTSAFIVRVNSVSRTVSSATISGSKVLLTLSSPVVYGDIVTIAYTKPSVNPLQTTQGGQAATFTAKSVNSNISLPPAVGLPVYLSVIESATPTMLEMTYNLSLANIIPATSAFIVRVNSTSRTVSSVAISGSKVFLTLSSPVVYGDVVTIAYTKPSVNPLQTTSGGDAASFTAKSVTNIVLSQETSDDKPVYVSSIIENGSPNMLEITYSLSLANIIPASSAFIVTVNSASRKVNSVTISNTKVILTLASDVAYGEVVTVAYDRPSTNQVQTPRGYWASALTAQPVISNITTSQLSDDKPIYISSVIESATPDKLEMTYSLGLANIIPAASSFIVIVNSVPRTVNSVAISDTKVLLTLSSDVVEGDVVSVAYNRPPVNQLQTSRGYWASALTEQQSVLINVSLKPEYLFASIENTTPTKLEMIYSLSLANIIPTTSAFSVKVNSVTRSVSSVSISGSKVILTLSSPVSYGNILTVAYNRPSSNQLQTPRGYWASALSAQLVINNLLSTLKSAQFEASDSQAGTDNESFGESSGTDRINISFYPNPASELIHISILEPSMESQIIKIYDFSGKLWLENRIEPGVRNMVLPINLKSGLYILKIDNGKSTVFNQQLIIVK